MKLLFSLLIILTSFFLFSCENKHKQENEIIGKTLNIARLEIAEHDFPEKMTWRDADSVCSSLGEGWRLPSTEELDIIYKNKFVIGGFRDDFYWSSDAGLQIGNINFAFKTNLNTGLSTIEDAWIDGEEKYNIQGKIVYSSPKDTIIQPLKTSYTNLPKEIFERKGTYRDLNFVRAVKMNLEPRSIIGNPFILENLVIAQNDFPNKMNWEDAQRTCYSLGEGWRVPTLDELNTMYVNRLLIGGFSKSYYWTSIDSHSYGPVELDFQTGRAYTYEIECKYTYKFKVRPVKSLKTF